MKVSDMLTVLNGMDENCEIAIYDDGNTKTYEITATDLSDAAAEIGPIWLVINGEYGPSEQN